MLSVFEFGKQLIESQDLDPVYTMLHHAKPSKFDRGKIGLWPAELCEYVIAYLMFYHCGTASWIVDQLNFWQAALEAARTAKHPRSSERRHFRGEAAVKAVLALQAHNLTCSELINSLESRNGAKTQLQDVVARVKQWRGFGDWAAFKVADICERLGLLEVEFSPMDIFNMYDSPRKGADLVAEQLGIPETGKYIRVYNRLIKNLGHLKAPPRFERTINIQEIETILCKFKSHVDGHYEVGKDIKEVHHGLLKYEYTPTAKLLLAAGKTGGLW